MNTPEEIGLTFLIIVRNYWARDTNLKEAMKDCRTNGNWNKGEKRTFRTFLVHKDTYIDGMGGIVYPNQNAADTAIDLGEL